MKTDKRQLEVLMNLMIEKTTDNFWNVKLHLLQKTWSEFFFVSLEI